MTQWKVDFYTADHIDGGMVAVGRILDDNQVQQLRIQMNQRHQWFEFTNQMQNQEIINLNQIIKVEIRKWTD